MNQKEYSATRKTVTTVEAPITKENVEDTFFFPKIFPRSHTMRHLLSKQNFYEKLTNIYFYFSETNSEITVACALGKRRSRFREKMFPQLLYLVCGD